MTTTSDTHAVVLCDAVGAIVYWSPGAEQLFGYKSAEAIGQRLDLIVPDDFRARHWAGFERAMKEGQARSSGSAVNLPVKLSNGEVRPFPARFVFLVDAHGRGVGAVAVYGEPVGDEQAFGPIVPRPTT